MSKIMQLKGIANKVHRSGFDLSSRVMFTAKVGEILPISYQEILPGDKFPIDLNTFMRTSPLQTASFGRFREYYDAYFVPYRLLYSGFQSTISLVNNPTKASTMYKNQAVSEDLPFITAGKIGEYLSYLESLDESSPYYYDEGGQKRLDSTRKLLSYLGYASAKIPTSPFGLLAQNPFFFLGYQKIYQDWFRFAQWEDSAAFTYNTDYLIESTSKGLYPNPSAFVTQKNFFDLQYCNYDKDYFHGLMPRPQYGDTAIAGPISGTLAGRLGMIATSNAVAGTDLDLYGDVSGNNNLSYVGSSSNNGNKIIRSNAFLQLENSLDNNAGLSVLSIRYAEMFQKWKEITLSATDYSYKSMLEKHWNVSTSELLSDRCFYLGGISKNITITEETNTNLVDDNEPLQKGKGSSSDSGKIFFDAKKFNNEYGVVMIIYHCKPIIEWKFSDLLLPAILRTKASSYPVPEFDSIGMQGVPKITFMRPPEDYTGAIEPFFKSAGYAPQYIDYKTSVDVVKGEFENTLKSWTIPYNIYDAAQDGSTPPDLTYLDFKVRPDIADGTFGVNAKKADHIRSSAFVGTKAVRNLDFDGLPY